MASWIGRRNPPYCTGVGKGILAFQPPDVIERVIQHGLRPYTPNTITDPSALRQHLALVRERGYAFDEEEFELGLQCVGAPVRDHTATVVAGISIAGPSHRMPRDRLEQLVGPVLEGAWEISRQLGYREATFTRRYLHFPGS